MVNRLSWKIRSKILAACAVLETTNRICLLLFASSSARLSSSSNAPWSIMPISSANNAISERIWLEIKIVFPRSLQRSRIKERTSAIPIGSRPLIGSSKIKSSGEVSIWGKPLAANEKKLLPRIGSLIESPGFYPNLTATENLRIFATLRGVPNRGAIKNALDLVGLPYKDKKLFPSREYLA